MEDFLKFFDFKEEEVRIRDDEAQFIPNTPAMMAAAVENPSKAMVSRKEISTDTRPQDVNHAGIRYTAFEKMKGFAVRYGIFG